MKAGEPPGKRSKLFIRPRIRPRSRRPNIAHTEPREREQPGKSSSVYGLCSRAARRYEQGRSGVPTARATRSLALLPTTFQPNGGPRLAVSAALAPPCALQLRVTHLLANVTRGPLRLRRAVGGHLEGYAHVTLGHLVVVHAASGRVSTLFGARERRGEAPAAAPAEEARPSRWRAGAPLIFGRSARAARRLPRTSRCTGRRRQPRPSSIPRLPAEESGTRSERG